MVRVMDNAPYNHVCCIPSLTSFSKKSTINLMKDHGIYYILFTLTDELTSILTKQYNHTINNGHRFLALRLSYAFYYKKAYRTN